MTWIGVDVSKRTLDVFVHEGVESVRFRQPEQLNRLVDFIAGHDHPRVVMESTGRYEQALFEALHARGIACSVVNPARARAFMKSVGSLAKTDELDARLLARMGAALEPKPTVLASEARRALQGLVTRREQLTRQDVMEQNHAEHASSPMVRASIERLRKHLKQELCLVQEQILKVLQSAEELQEPSRRLQTVPGVGPAIATGLLVYLPELGTLSKGEAAALAGLAPYNVDSGMRRGTRRIRAGRSPIRALLYMAALVAARHNPVLREVYKRLLSRGKAKKAALIAVARKLVVVLNALLKNQQDWRPEPCPCTTA